MASRIEGFVGRLGSVVRDFFAREPERHAAQVQRGLGTPYLGHGKGSVGGAMGGAWGQSSFVDYLYLEQDLVSRYIEYEEMDDYPEVGCLEGSCMVFTLEWGWKRIEELAAYGDSFYVISYDRDRKSLVPAKATKAMVSAPDGHGKAMVRVTLDNGTQIVCTSDHTFMTKDGEWVDAGDLMPTMRLMPGVFRLGCLGGSFDGIYWQIHQPSPDSKLRSSDGKRWMWLHRLVAEEMLGIEQGSGDIIHHGRNDSLNNSPENLFIETNSSHAMHHIAGIDNSMFLPEWTDERKAEQAEKMRGNTFSRGCKRSEKHKKAISMAQNGRRKSEDHRLKIGLSQPTRIDLSRADVESALNLCGTIAEAARLLGVSWGTLKRNAERYDLLVDGNNHRVLRVEVIDERPAVYDLHVPGFHNFVCDGVVVHNTALDIYADDATVPTADDETVIWGYSNDKDVKQEIDHVLAKVGAHDDIWAQVRTLCKYGDTYAEIVLGSDSKDGVIGLNFLPPPTVRRIEHPNVGLLGFMQNPTGLFPSDLTSFWNFWSQYVVGGSSANMSRAYQAYAQSFSKFSTAVMFEDWEVVHWRLRGKHLRSIYGYPVIEPARWPWRRLALMEDAAIFYKLERTPSRHAFYIDIGSDDARRGKKKLEDARRDLSRKRYVNKQGQLDTRFNILAPDEDFFIPVRDGKRMTDVELIQGADFSETDTLDYFRRKLVSSLKVPQSYMGSAEGEARNMLSSEDIRFARTEMRVQHATRRGWHKVMRVHFAAQGRQVQPEDFDVRMAVPSQILDLARSEVMSAKADLATRLQEIVGTKWVLVNVLGFSEDEAVEILDDKRSQAIAQAQTDAETERLRAPPMESVASDTPDYVISRMLQAQSVASARHRRSLDWRREFESKGGRAAERAADRKLDKLLAENADIRKRLHAIGGLLSDIRAAHKPVHFEPRQQ